MQRYADAGLEIALLARLVQGLIDLAGKRIRRYLHEIKEGLSKLSILFDIQLLTGRDKHVVVRPSTARKAMLSPPRRCPAGGPRCALRERAAALGLHGLLERWANDPERIGRLRAAEVLPDAMNARGAIAGNPTREQARDRLALAESSDDAGERRFLASLTLVASRIVWAVTMSWPW